MADMPQMRSDEALAVVLASLAAVAAGFIYLNAVYQSLANDDRRGGGRLAAAAIASLAIAVIAFQADRLRFLLFTAPQLTAQGTAAVYVGSVPRLLWVGIPLLTHGLVLLVRNNLQLYRLRKSNYEAWQPDFGDWLSGGALAVGGAYVLWQWHPKDLPAAFGWAVAGALCIVASAVLWRWSAKE